MLKANDDPIELAASQHEAWGERFLAERDRIDDALRQHSLRGHVERIEHVGSTAVPDLPAKDIVDLDVVVADGTVRTVSQTLESELGGDRIENSERWHPIFRVENGQRFNDHVFAVSDDGWKVSVITREVLRARPDLRAEYERLKRELSREHDELLPYSQGKTAFIERVLEVARASDDLSFDIPLPTDT
jgi:GrpB-like predicted nucleotidyltransferase (UPF0157 family)